MLKWTFRGAGWRPYLQPHLHSMIIVHWQADGCAALHSTLWMMDPPAPDWWPPNGRSMAIMSTAILQKLMGARTRYITAARTLYLGLQS